MPTRPSLMLVVSWRVSEPRLELLSLARSLVRSLVPQSAMEERPPATLASIDAVKLDACLSSD
eukprot:4895811-Prymnesium_polylepis.1